MECWHGDHQRIKGTVTSSTEPLSRTVITVQFSLSVCQFRASTTKHLETFASFQESISQDFKTMSQHANYFKTETSAGLKAAPKKARATLQEMEEYRKKKTLQVKTEQQLQRTKIMEEKEQLASKLREMETKVQEMQETHKEMQFKLRRSEKNNEFLQVKFERELQRRREITEETESHRRAFKCMHQENQHLKNTIKQMQKEKIQLEEKNRELEAQNKHLGEISKQDLPAEEEQSQPNLKIINEGWERHLKNAQGRIIQLMEYRKQKDGELREMSKRLCNLQETNKELRFQLWDLEEGHGKKSQQLQAKVFKTEKSGDLKAARKKARASLQEMEAVWLEKEYGKKKSLQVKTEQELQRTKIIEEEKEQLAAKLSKMETKVQQMEGLADELLHKLHLRDERINHFKVMSDGAVQREKEILEEKEQLVAKLSEMETKVQQMETTHKETQFKLHQSMKKNEQHAGEHKELEQLKEKCKKLEEETQENICAIKNLVLQNKELQEYYLKKKQKRRWFFHRDSAAPPAHPGQNT